MRSCPLQECDPVLQLGLATIITHDVAAEREFPGNVAAPLFRIERG
jgi:hypothetical protein